jgi:hypothetical protein
MLPANGQRELNETANHQNQKEGSWADIIWAGATARATLRATKKSSKLAVRYLEQFTGAFHLWNPVCSG